jgi:hypothetical protein
MLFGDRVRDRHTLTTTTAAVLLHLSAFLPASNLTRPLRGSVGGPAGTGAYLFVLAESARDRLPACEPMGCLGWRREDRK